LHATQDIGGVDAADANYFEHGELQQAFADGDLLRGGNQAGTFFRKGT